MHSFTSSIRTDDDCIFKIWNMQWNPTNDSWLGKKIINGYIEKALENNEIRVKNPWSMMFSVYLNLWSMKIHGYNMISTSHTQHIGNKFRWNRCSTLSNNSFFVFHLSLSFVHSLSIYFIFSILSRVGKTWNDSCNSWSRCYFACIDHNQ